MSSHNSGTLKQNNKKHKGKASKREQKRIQGSGKTAGSSSGGGGGGSDGDGKKKGISKTNNKKNAPKYVRKTNAFQIFVFILFVLSSVSHPFLFSHLIISSPFFFFVSLTEILASIV